MGVDPVELKRVTALKVGATHAFASIEEADAFAKSITDGQGADEAIVTVGVITGEDVAQAFQTIRKAGTVVITSLCSHNSTEGLPISPQEITLMQKRIQGALFGMCNPVSDIPRQIQMYQNGKLKLDELITRTYTLDEICTGYDDMRVGKNIRGIILFD